MPTEPQAVEQVLPSAELASKILPPRVDAPSLPPTQAGSAVGPPQTAPPPLAVAQLAGIAGDGPKLAPAGTHPPVTAADAAVKTAATAGMSAGNVTALWSINEDRNSWVGITGPGWVKLSTASETGIMALTALASHAKAGNRYISYATDPGSKELTQMYVW